MRYFLIPDVDFTNSKLVDHTGKPLEAQFEQADTLSYSVKWDDNEKLVRFGLHEKSLSSGDVIRIDLNKQRLRLVSRDCIGAKPSSGSSTVQPTEVDIRNINVQTRKLKDIDFDPRLFIPIKTGTYLDKFVSHKGGFMPAINIMVTGDPGVGKSSNLMDILVNIKDNDPTKRVLYISAEMDDIEVKEFEKYYPGLSDIEFLYLGDYIVNADLNIKPYQALMAILLKGWDMVVIDSLIEVQSMLFEDLGMTNKKVEKWLLDLLKTHNQGHNDLNLFTTFLCIQQKNKSNQYVGSKRLEHMTSAFLKMCWSKKENGRRYMIFEKNRRGREKVELYYNFAENGIEYDEKRHIKELMIMDRIGKESEFELEEMSSIDFDKVFAQIDDNDEF